MFSELKHVWMQKMSNQKKMDEMRMFSEAVQKRANGLQLDMNRLQTDYANLAKEYRRLECENRSLRMDNDLIHRYCASAYEELARRAVNPNTTGGQ